jgi:hypothetical protein
MAVAESPHITREDLVLATAAGAAGPYQLDPIRLMKACFLISQRGRADWKAQFDFRPYSFGPFDAGVYRARDALLARGLLVADRSGRYPAYSLSDEGHEEVARLREVIGDDNADWLARIGAYVTAKSFSELLDEVYATFPKFAVRSVVAH